jgi:GNAT superfamily N-acetyltransferase
MKKDILSTNADRKYLRWQIFDNNDNYIAYINISLTAESSPEYESNKDQAWVFGIVNLNYRRLGIGTYILEFVKKKSKELMKEKLFMWAELTNAKAFLKNLGGVISYKNYESRLYLDNIDWKLIRSWILNVHQKSPGICLERFDDVPESFLEEYCSLFTEVANQAPMEDLEGQEIVTPRTRRQKEERFREIGYLWTTFISREMDQKISGLTEIIYDPKRPFVVFQELTGVKQEYRGRRLGKLLKAKMLLYLKYNYPAVKYIQTGNAQSNQHMLQINREMGFKTYVEGHAYKFLL